MLFVLWLRSYRYNMWKKGRTFRDVGKNYRLL
jgi:hypothetical protein